MYALEEKEREWFLIGFDYFTGCNVFTSVADQRHLCIYKKASFFQREKFRRID